MKGARQEKSVRYVQVSRDVLECTGCGMKSAFPGTSGKHEWIRVVSSEETMIQCKACNAIWPVPIRDNQITADACVCPNGCNSRRSIRP